MIVVEGADGIEVDRQLSVHLEYAIHATPPWSA
jgi:hypothetical protein